eukprot:CAMPEP_0176155390 /NCGR_PEP_ID=MMETSP0120_2-20121206/79407_1 /TAXON_ID=160619 /ORGANISM="Kryptoperidinium foliaceum, Strain CCMP 1326" /LENGTH=54 /DNA_ID=CAMNT_0017492547 /DNA_START=245 /DNA_END=405 /DNA_ORIENTATION=+
MTAEAVFSHCAPSPRLVKRTPVSRAPPPNTSSSSVMKPPSAEALSANSREARLR